MLTARHNFTGIRIDDEKSGERATDSKRRDILGGGKVTYPTRLTFDEKRIYVEDKDEEGPAALTFTMDAIFGPNTRQRDVWAEVGVQHVNSVLQGYNSTIFAVSVPFSSPCTVITTHTGCLSFLPNVIRLIFAVRPDGEW
jgi:hypothetical protein